jgi:hypothetical protein
MGFKQKSPLIFFLLFFSMGLFFFFAFGLRPGSPAHVARVRPKAVFGCAKFYKGKKCIFDP